MLPVSDEGPDKVDPPLGVCCFLLPAGQRSHALEQLLFPTLRLLPALLEPPRPGAGLEAVDVAQDQRHERARMFAPARSRDVDFPDAAHAVLVEERANGSLSRSASRDRGHVIDEIVVVADL